MRRRPVLRLIEAISRAGLAHGIADPAHLARALEGQAYRGLAWWERHTHVRVRRPSLVHVCQAAEALRSRSRAEHMVALVDGVLARAAQQERVDGP